MPFLKCIAQAMLKKGLEVWRKVKDPQPFEDFQDHFVLRVCGLLIHYLKARILWGLLNMVSI